MAAALELIAMAEDAGATIDFPAGYVAQCPLYAGIDVARDHDKTVLNLDEHIGDVAWTRMVLRLHATPFPKQFAILDPWVKLTRRTAIDSTGMGIALYDYLNESNGGRVMGVNFAGNNDNGVKMKTDLAIRMKKRFEKHLDRIPENTVDPQIRQELMAIKREATASGVTFDAPRIEVDTAIAGGKRKKIYSHADIFWAKALADFAADNGAISTEIHGSAPVDGAQASGGIRLMANEPIILAKPPAEEIVTAKVLESAQRSSLSLALGFGGTSNPSTIWQDMISDSSRAFGYYRELEEKDDDVGGSIEELKLSVLSRERAIVPADDSSQAIEIADFIRAQFDELSNFENILYSLLDAAPMGVSIAELMFDVSSDLVALTDIKDRPQELFTFGQWSEPQIGPLRFLKERLRGCCRRRARAGAEVRGLQLPAARGQSPRTSAAARRFLAELVQAADSALLAPLRREGTRHRGGEVRERCERGREEAGVVGSRDHHQLGSGGRTRQLLARRGAAHRGAQPGPGGL
jgi:hypothetical protein